MPNTDYPTVALTSGAIGSTLHTPKGYTDHAVVFIATHIPGDVAAAMHHHLQNIANNGMQCTEMNYPVVSNADMKSEETIVREAQEAADATLKIALLMSEAALLELAKHLPSPAVDELAANCRDAAMALTKKEESNDG